MVSLYRKLKFGVLVKPDAGKSSGVADEDYEARDATITKDVRSSSEIVVKKFPPTREEIVLIKNSKKLELLICYLYPTKNSLLLEEWKGTNINVLALEQIPRNTREQKLDTLSSMTKIAGYRG